MSHDDPSSLETLNAAERDILLLLGRGHTAKSIASLRGHSILAVNERLRSARRKTGVTSSRELARLVIAQENRDDLIALAKSAPTTAASLRPDVPPLRRMSKIVRWRTPMAIVALLAAIALLAQQTSKSVEPQAKVPTNPVVAAIIPDRGAAPTAADLHAEANGPPDPAWSSAMERTLTDRYRSVFQNLDIQSLTVVCSATICEVSGRVPSEVSDRSASDFTARIDNAASGKRIPGLWTQYQVYGPVDRAVDSAGAEGFAFVVYWRRT